MNRLFTLILIGLAGLLASCGTTVSSSTQPGTNDLYSVAISPDRLTLNAGDWSSITATVDLSNQNSTPKPVTPPPTIQFSSSDSRVTISPGGEVCAGQWDTRYLTCTQTLCGTNNPNCAAGAPPTQLDLPTGQVTVTAYNASHNVSATTFVTVHPRAASISLTSDWSQRSPLPSCISQNDQVTYFAAPLDPSGNPIKVFAANDYTWVVGDTNVASVSSLGKVIAHNPGVTSVYAKLNGTASTPLAFATCPPSAIVLASFPYTNGTLPSVGTIGDTADLALSNGNQKYLTATPVDANGTLLSGDPACNPLVVSNCAPLTLPITYITSDPLTGSITPVLSLTSKLTANAAGGFTATAACLPPTCNASVPDFVSPAGLTTGKTAGFGYPIYSNVIGVTVQGTTGSTVLVTGTTYSDGKTEAHRLLAYDSESLANTQTVALANVPNSMVVAPNGVKAYLGSSNGLMVVDLTTFQSTISNFPVAGGITTDVVTGTVLGVSPDSRYVLVSDVPNGLVFFIDTTGSKSATRYLIPNIDAVTFAADDSNFWIGANPAAADTTAYSGVYSFQSDTFVPIKAIEPRDANLSTHVKALAWMPDGQSYFASGDQLVNYSTCDNQKPQSLLTNLPTTVLGNRGGLSTTVLNNGVPQLVGLSGSQWFDYSVTTTAQIPVGKTTPTGTGNVCNSTVNVNPPATTPPATTPSTLLCLTANQISFSPRLEQAFITGVDPSCAPESLIHGYDLVTGKEITFTTTAPIIPLSGSPLNDGRKLYIGTFDSTGATLHRINLDPTAGALAEDAAVSVGIVPSFVAVVPK